MKKIFGSLLLLSLTGGALAQEDGCPTPNVDKDAAKVKSLFEQVKSGQRNFDSVDGFLEQLSKDTPNLMSNFILMGESRSFQTASRENPRVILMSPGGDVRLTFNTDPNQRGYNNIEISFWNPQKREFEYRELALGSTPPAKLKAHGEKELEGACSTCHGDPPKPNWDNYNFWSGVIPFNKDTLVPDKAPLGRSAEVNWYLDLLLKTEQQNANNRLRFLKPIESRATIEQRISAGESIVRQFLDDNGNPRTGSGGGISVQFFDNMVARQRCAQGKLASQLPNFNQFKFIMAGLQNGCPNMDSFVPPWYSTIAKRYFYGTLPTFDFNKVDNKNLSQSMRSMITADTERRMKYQVKDKTGRQLNFWEQEFIKDGKSPAEAKRLAQQQLDRSIEAIGLNVVGPSPGQNPELLGEQPEQVGDFRYFLEPFGVKVANFSSSIDPNTYTFSDLFSSNYLDQKTMTAIGQEAGGDDCESLAKKSQEVLGSPETRDLVADNATNLCQSRLSLDQSITEFDKLDKVIIRQRAEQAFRARCFQCHTSADPNNPNRNYSTGGAPLIPFNKISDLESYLKRDDNRTIGMASKISERLNRHRSLPGAMPAVVHVTQNEKAYMALWIKQFTGEDKISVAK